LAVGVEVEALALLQLVVEEGVVLEDLMKEHLMFLSDKVILLRLGMEGLEIIQGVDYLVLGQT
jgi:hypothetical protein